MPWRSLIDNNYLVNKSFIFTFENFVAMAIPDLNPRDVMCDQCLGTIEISFQQQSSISIDPGNVKDLKHSQYKNDDIQLKNFLGLKLPPFFPSPCR